MVTIANRYGNEIGIADFIKIDVDINETRDFELTIPAEQWDDRYSYGNRIYIPGTEYGGVIGRTETSSEDNTVLLSGYCWRGILSKKIIEPPSGEAYKVVSGELNQITKSLISEAGMTALFSVSSEASGATVIGFHFDRYATLLDGLVKMYKSVDYRLDIKYMVQEQGLPGYVSLSAMPIVDHSNTKEISQDGRIKFVLNEKKDGVNHLVCLGKGELTERIVVHLYVQDDGSIGTSKYYYDEEEIAEVYENVSAENEADLTERGTERLLELTNKQEFKSNVASMDIEVEIGDVIGGRDYITGMSVKKPILNKIYTESNGEITKEYKMEGDEQ